MLGRHQKFYLGGRYAGLESDNGHAVAKEWSNLVQLRDRGLVKTMGSQRGWNIWANAFPACSCIKWRIPCRGNVLRRSDLLLQFPDHQIVEEVKPTSWWSL